MEVGPKVFEESSQAPDLYEELADQQVTIYGITGTFSELGSICPEDLSQASLEAKNNFIVRTGNVAGIEIQPKHEKIFKDITERLGIEPGYKVSREKAEDIKDKVELETEANGIEVTDRTAVSSKIGNNDILKRILENETYIADNGKKEINEIRENKQHNIQNEYEAVVDNLRPAAKVKVRNNPIKLANEVKVEIVENPKPLTEVKKTDTPKIHNEEIQQTTAEPVSLISPDLNIPQIKDSHAGPMVNPILEVEPLDFKENEPNDEVENLVFSNFNNALFEEDNNTELFNLISEMDLSSVSEIPLLQINQEQLEDAFSQIETALDSSLRDIQERLTNLIEEIQYVSIELDEVLKLEDESTLELETKLVELLTDLFDTADIEYTPELISSAVELIKFQQIFTIAEVETNFGVEQRAHSEKNNREFLFKLKHGLKSVKKLFYYYLKIGQSAIRFYNFKVLAADLVN